MAFGFGKKWWKRISGLSNAQRKISRATGVPLSGRKNVKLTNPLAWVLGFMPEHVHLLVYPRRPNYKIKVIVKEIKELVGRQAVKHLRAKAPQWLPRITVRRGRRLERRFWQAGGGFDRNAFEPKTLLAMIEYIHANPVRRNLAARAEDWKWSSAGWFEGKNSLRPDPIDVGGCILYSGGRG
jgi:REP element-mobilizing transposase RayT